MCWGVVGEAFRSGSTCIGNDIASDERFRPWREQLREAGARAGAAFALMRDGQCAGALVLVHDADAREQVEQVVRKLLRAAGEPVLVDECGGQTCAVSASIGIAMAGAGDADGQALIRQADDAMYRAKQQGRDSFAFHA